MIWYDMIWLNTFFVATRIHESRVGMSRILALGWSLGMPSRSKLSTLGLSTNFWQKGTSSACLPVAGHLFVLWRREMGFRTRHPKARGLGLRPGWCPWVAICGGGMTILNLATFDPGTHLLFWLLFLGLDPEFGLSGNQLLNIIKPPKNNTPW